MLNAKVKKEAVENLKAEIKNYEEVQKNVQSKALDLHNARVTSVEVIELLESYINKLANTPKQFDKDFKEIHLNIDAFKVLTEIKYDEEMMVKIVGGSTITGVAAGVATAAMGPTAAMAIATTFGTASTGAAISGLSGVAATNAALAWLGGGALAAGGGGMAAGNALLLLAGPIGWSLAAGTLLFGGVLARDKNKKIAIKADADRLNVIKNAKGLEVIQGEIIHLIDLTTELQNQLYKSLILFINKTKTISSYNEFSLQQRDELRALINNAQSLSKLFMKEITANNEEF